MNVTNRLYEALRLRMIDLYIAILGRLDGGVDGMVKALTSIDERLERLQARRRMAVSRLLDKGIESRERELAAKRRERAVREELNRKLDDAYNEAARAARIRQRVQAIMQ